MLTLATCVTAAVLACIRVASPSTPAPDTHTATPNAIEPATSPPGTATTDSGNQVVRRPVSVPAAHALAARIVDVVTPAGLPIGGARVELVESTMLPRVSWLRSDRDVVVVHDAGTTDARGQVVLRGPSNRSLALRLPGPGHEPVIVQPFALRETVPARVVVRTGAKLHGRILPREQIARWHAVATRTPGGAGWPCLFLEGAGDRLCETFPADRTGLRIDDAGRFDVTGVPAGAWDLVLEYFTTVDRVPWITRRVAIAGLVVGEGDDRELTLDLDDQPDDPQRTNARTVETRRR